MIFQSYFFPTVLVMFLAGCSSTTPLELDNIMEFNSKLDAAKAEHDEKTVQALTTSEAQKTDPTKSFSPSINPPELGLLKWPSPVGEVKDAGMISALSEKLPGAAYFWDVDEGRFFAAAGKTAMNADVTRKMGADQFHQELERTAKDFDRYYWEKHQARAAYEISEDRSVKKLEVTSQYLKDAKWWVEKRIIYFYDPSFRLNLLIVGEDAAVEETMNGLQKSLNDFFSELCVLYPEGFQSSGSD